MKIKIISLLFIFIMFGCKKNENDLFNEAQEKIKNNKLEEAVIDYEKIIKDYSETENAKQSLYELAKIYQSKLIKSVSEQESLNKAINYYNMLINKFPQSKEAPQSLFMVGFIQANELKNFDSASLTYKKFLNMYPEHELANSAKEELNNLGLTPEEILHRKTTLK